jgi:uncharacterized protein HemX
VTSDARTRWASLRPQLDAAASGTKESQSVVLELSKRYAALAGDERGTVDELLAEWVLSDDPNLRFDAMALISDHNIRSALPWLRLLAERLEDASGSSAPYEWTKVNRLIAKLTGVAEP